MTNLDKERRLVADRVKKFEKTAHEIHEMADKLHKKMEQLHLETIATRNDTGKSANSRGSAPGSPTKKLDFIKSAALNFACRGSTQVQTAEIVPDLREDESGAPEKMRGDGRISSHCDRNE